VAVALHVLSDDRPIQHVERGEQRRRAVPFVVVGHRAGAALLDRQAGLGAVKCLDLRPLVDRQHHGMGRQIDIQGDDLGEFLCEGWRHCEGCNRGLQHLMPRSPARKT